MPMLLLYHTKTGHTLEAGKAIAAGVTEAGGSIQLVLAKDFNPAQARDCDLLIVGSPCWGGSMGAGVSAPIAAALKQLTTEINGKPCAGFSVNGSVGGLNTVKALGVLLKRKKCSEYLPGPVAKGGAPLSLWKGPAIKDKDLSLLKSFGAQLVQKLGMSVGKSK